ncbi:restriction endonuclease [Deefgea piscis]|uniref:restriction endonuclease n=1 Tax=Deefgea piscis TaxID=2739061 RepID=UPI002107A868|nr:restriction endonuclease [Deefgea piscis]
MALFSQELVPPRNPVRFSKTQPSTPPFSNVATPPIVAFDRRRLAQLHFELLELVSLNAHARGFAFEKFLKNLFDAYGLSAREAFRIQGEQIDGSFALNSEIYLLEAKWHNSPIGAADLHTFHGKIDQKAAWTRGLFISHSSFTTDGLHAFGRGKRIICMDGLDLSEMLTREIPLNHVLERKIRRAGETGQPFAQVRDLFP